MSTSDPFALDRHLLQPINELATALAAAQSEMKVVANKSNNPFFNAKYADFATIKAQTDPILSKHGLAVIQGGAPTTTPELVMWTTVNRDGEEVKNYGCWSTFVTRLVHTSGQWIEYAQTFLVPNPTPQSMGSATTYAKRYGYSAIVGVYTANEDDDGEGAEGRKTPNAAYVPSDDDVEDLLGGL